MTDPYQQFREKVVAAASCGGIDWVVLRSVSSTNALARTIAKRSLPVGSSFIPTALVAWTQEDGRGRGESRWLSAAGGGVWATLLFRRLTPEQLAQLPLLTAIALAEAIGRLIQVEVGLKWPNDLYVRGAKLGGVLIEGVSRGSSCTGIVGFGVNHGSRLPLIEGRQTTSVSCLSASPPSLGYLTTTLISEVVSTVLDPPEDSLIISRYRDLSVHKPGDAMRLKFQNQFIDGEYQGIDDSGMLIVATESGPQHISAAEVLMP